MKNKIVQSILKILPFLFLSTVLFANEEGKTSTGESNLGEWILHHILFIVATFVIIAAFGAIFNLINKLFEVQKMLIMREQGISMEDGVKKESWFSKMYKGMTKAVPIEKEKDVLLDHDYDGIRELDNILPPWWVALFNITIIWAVVYIGYFHFSDYGQLQEQEYQTNMSNADKSVKAYLASRTDLVDETNVELTTDDSKILMGETIYQSKCIACHGGAAEGNSIGPNLVDKYWLHGGDIKDVFKTIKYGIPEKGMISWKSQLSPKEIQNVSSYILSLQGTTPPNAKEPQGDLYEPEE